jgi:hypothetical protein
MTPVLFAVNTVWIVIFFLVVATSVSWMLFRLVVDFAKWFKEEIIDDILHHRREAEQKQQAMIRTQKDG